MGQSDTTRGLQGGGVVSDNTFQINCCKMELFSHFILPNMLFYYWTIYVGPAYRTVQLSFSQCDCAPKQ